MAAVDLKTVIFIHLFSYLRVSHCAIEEIEATPTNTNAFELGDLSMPQFLVFSIVFLIIINLYAVGVVPIEIDLGYFYGTGSGAFFPRQKRDIRVPMNTLMYDCPLQFICEVDMWANREDHEYFVDKLIARWFKNSNSTFRNSKTDTFTGTGTCKEMYPCPIDVQKVIGITIPGSEPLKNSITDNEDNIEKDDEIFVNYRNVDS